MLIARLKSSTCLHFLPSFSQCQDPLRLAFGLLRSGCCSVPPLATLWACSCNSPITCATQLVCKLFRVHTSPPLAGLSTQTDMRSLISHRMLLLSWSRRLRVRIALGNQIEVMTAETRNALGCPSFSAPPDTRMANINLTAITEIADATGRGVLGMDCATYLR